MPGRGSPIAAQTIAAARAARSIKREVANAGARAVAVDLTRSGLSLRAIAQDLQRRGIRSPAGRPSWQPGQVSRLLAGRVSVVVAGDHIYLPLDDIGNVPADWRKAPDTKRVAGGVRLQMPAELAQYLAGKVEPASRA